MNVSQITPADISQIEPLIHAYPFKSYRNYRVLARTEQTAVMAAEISATLNHRDGIVMHASADDRSAAVVARTLEWDTHFFGVPMARLEYVLGPTDVSTSALVAGLEQLKGRGVVHISARVDVADVEVMTLLEAHGFRLMDALVTYTQRPRKEPARDVREVGTVRDFRPEDGPELLQIATDAYRGFRGRFHLDSHIPDDRSDAFYVEWARQCISLTMAETILVSEGSEGQLLGFLAYRRREPVSSVGSVPVFGGGLGACRPDAPGAYAGLIRAGTIRAHQDGGVAECQTQNYNFPVIRIYEAVGAHYVRAEYTLHRWLGAE